MQLSKLTFVILFLLSLASSAEAQRCGLIIQNNDSLKYSLFIGGVQKGDQIASTLQFDSLSCGTCLLDLIMRDSLTTHIRTDLVLDTNWVPQLILSRDSLGTHLVLANKDERPMSSYLTPGATSAAGIDMQVWQMDGTPCAPPATPAQVNAWSAELEVKEFERDRMRLLRQLFSGEQCLTTEQISTLIGFLDDEDKRLELLRSAYENCYDKANFSQLKELLYLSRSREAFDLFVQ